MGPRVGCAREGTQERDDPKGQRKSDPLWYQVQKAALHGWVFMEWGSST